MDRQGNSVHPSQSSPAGLICSKKQQTSIRRRRWVTDPYMYLTWAFPLNPLSGSANRLRQSRIDPERSLRLPQSCRSGTQGFHEFRCSEAAVRDLTHPARSGRSSSAPDSGHPGGRICYTPVPGIDQTTHHASCCFTCVVILPCAIFLILNRRLQNMLSDIPMLCGRTVALKQS